MAVTYGFYNSVGGDRKYDATQMSALFDGIITDGVFSTVGEALIVRPNTTPNKTVTVGDGRAWFDHTWTNSDTDLVLTVSNAHSSLPRIDLVILEVNKTTRVNSIKMLNGTANSNPQRPALTKNANVTQYALAQIYLPAGDTAITADQITNLVGTAETPFAAGAAQQVSTSELLAQWNAQFDLWFNAMKGQLTTDAAGNLQTQINNHNHDGGDGATLGTNALLNNAVTFDKAGAGVLRAQYRLGGDASNWSIPGTTPYGLGNITVQFGSVSIPISNGNSAMVYVTVPLGYGNYPLVFATLSAIHIDWTVTAIPYAMEPFYRVIQIHVKRVSEVNTSTTLGVNWLTIGPSV